MVQPIVSMLALLKEQRARKAAAKKAAEDSETESETQPESSENLNPPPASENPLVTPPRLSWNFSDEAAIPSGFRRKDGTRSEPQAYADIAQLEHNPPIRRSTPPFATIPAANKLRRQEPSPQPQLRHASQASSSQKRHSSPAKKSHRPKI